MCIRDSDDIGLQTVTINYADNAFNFENCQIQIEVTDPMSACTATPLVTTVDDGNLEEAIEEEEVLADTKVETNINIEDEEDNLEENTAKVNLTKVRAYPNPFIIRTAIEYHLSAPAHTQITVWDATGKQVETLLDKVVGSGNHKIFWHAENQATGLYLIRIQVENEAPQVVRMTKQ